jgi:hypothetical protein
MSKSACLQNPNTKKRFNNFTQLSHLNYWLIDPPIRSRRYALKKIFFQGGSIGMGMFLVTRQGGMDKMTYLKKIVVLLTATFFSYSLVAMEDQGAFKILPEELLLYIIRYLNLKDLNRASLVSKRWNVLASDDAIWVVLATSIPVAKRLKEEKSNWIHRNKKAAEDVLALGSWNKEKVAAAITDQNYEKLEETLISHWESVVIAKSIEQGIISPQDFLSILIAHYEINISAAFTAARDDDAWDFAGISAWCIAENVTEHALDDAVASDAVGSIEDAARDPENAAYDAERVAAVEAAYNAARDAAKPIVQAQLLKMPSNEPIKMAKNRWRLNSLYVQAYISQEQFLEAHFIKSYRAFKGILDKVPNFRQSKDDTAKILAGRTWEKKDLENNPHIKSLRRLVETLAAQTKEPKYD